MAAVPAIFRTVVFGLVTAIFASYKEPLGAQQWAIRYSSLISKSPLDDPVTLHLPPHPASRGVYKPNDLLQRLTKLGDGLALAPEDLLPDPTETFLYVTNQDGWVKKLFLATGQVQNWTYVGGRPLGLALDHAGDVFVCEPLQSVLLKINKDTGAKETLATEAGGVKFGIINGVIVATDGLVYFTDTTTKDNITNFRNAVLEGRPYGRIGVYDPRTNSTTVLVEGLYFPNGISLSKSEDFLIFCESSMFRCSKYFLKGRKRGKTERFIENLPAGPDNIHYNKRRDRYYIAMVGDRDALSDFVAKTPILKHLLAVSSELYDLYDPYTLRIGKVLEVDESGKALQMYEDSTGEAIAFITVGIPVGAHLYVGGFSDNFVGRVDLVL